MTSCEDRVVSFRKQEAEENRRIKRAKREEVRNHARRLGWERFVALQSGREGWQMAPVIPTRRRLPVEVLHDFYDDGATLREKEQMVQAGYRPRRVSHP